MESFTVPELRQQLKLRGLDTTGLKKVLIERLEAADIPKIEAMAGKSSDLSANKKDAAEETVEETIEEEINKKKQNDHDGVDSEDQGNMKKARIENPETSSIEETVPSLNESTETSTVITSSETTETEIPIPSPSAPPQMPTPQVEQTTIVSSTEEVTPSPTANAAVAAAMGLVSTAPSIAPTPTTVATPMVAPHMSLTPTTPQGIALGVIVVTTQLVVNDTIARSSITAINEISSKLPDVTITLPPYGQSVMPPLMNNEMIITITGPFISVHAAYIQLVLLTYGQMLTNVKLIVGNDEASALIGKAGSAIRDVRLGLGGAANCFKILERNPSNPNQRLVTFTGDLILVIKAHELVQDKLIRFLNRDVASSMFPNSSDLSDPNATSGKAGELSTQVQVPNETLGAVIGKGGSRIREIRTLSGAKITIEPQVDQNPYRLVSIVGNNEGVEWAKYLITVAMSGGEPSQSLGTSIPPGMALAAQQQASTATTPQYSASELQAAGYTPEQINAYLSQVQTQSQQPGFSMMPNGQGIKLTIPNEGVGSIIGKGGCKINHMRQLSGARINILEPIMGSPVRCVTIEGDTFSISKGQIMLTMAQAGVDVSTWQPHDLQQAMQQHGVNAGAPGGGQPYGGQPSQQGYGQYQPQAPQGGGYGQYPNQPNPQYGHYGGGRPGY